MEDQMMYECSILRVNELNSGKIQFTDSTNAERLFREHGDNIRYMAAWKKWLVWSGSRWEVDESGALIQDKCLKTIRGIHREVLNTGNFRECLEIEKFAIMSENARRRKHCVELATLIKELNVNSDQLDTNSNLLNCRNGTVNLLTGEFSEHN